jgi:TetR/AcrR family transcriptional regulator, cholesterol catabolism regulator
MAKNPVLFHVKLAPSRWRGIGRRNRTQGMTKIVSETSRKETPAQLYERSIPDVTELPQYQLERRQKIIDVATELLLERAGNVEVRDVVERADVSLASVYRYFGSKEVLLATAFVQWREQNYGKRAGDAGRPDTPSGRLRAAVGRFIDLYGGAPQMWDLHVSTRSSTNPGIVALRSRYEQAVLDHFREVLRDLRDEDAAGIISVLVAVYAWHMTRWRAGDIKIDDVRAEVDRALRLTLDVRRGLDANATPTKPRRQRAVPAAATRKARGRKA